MTTERIDYAREARGSIAQAYRNRAMGDETASRGRVGAAEHYFAASRDCVGFAQVEATLALVEQQRIANLIAVWNGPTGAAEALALGGVSFDAVREAIREGLSL